MQGEYSYYQARVEEVGAFNILASGMVTMVSSFPIL